MGKILCLCGKVGSGKNTLCNFLHGYQLRAYNKIHDFELAENGDLVVIADDENGERVSALINVTQKDNPSVYEWASYNMWPYVKQYGFADNLKMICHGLFGIERHKLYGTHEQKNELTDIKFKDLPLPLTAIKKLGNPNDYMTARQFMQIFATEIMRKIKDDVWVSSLLKEIKSEDSQLAIITDGRFLNEAEAIKEAGGKTIYLTRTITEDSHISENELTKESCDAFIDNQNLSLLDTCRELVSILDGWGWMENTI